MIQFLAGPWEVVRTILGIPGHIARELNGGSRAEDPLIPTELKQPAMDAGQPPGPFAFTVPGVWLRPGVTLMITVNGITRPYRVITVTKTDDNTWDYYVEPVGMWA